MPETDTALRSARSARTRHAQKLFDGMPREYDFLAELLSFGQNARWRRFLVSRVPPSSGEVLDVATGTAGVAIALVRRGKARRVVALDQNKAMLLRGRDAVAEALTDGKIALVLGQGERLPFPDGVFDCVTVTYLLRYVDDPGATLAELARVLRPGGKLVSLEFFVPPNQGIRALWWFHTRVLLPLAGRFASREWFAVGRFLGPSISGFYRRYPLPEQIGMWRAAGLREIGFRTMSFGGGIVIWAVNGKADAR